MVKFPRYIKDNPEGNDKFDGKSQTILSHVIAEHIISNDNLSDDEAMPKIIGIEGAWGSGKTNVIRLVKKALEDKYIKCKKAGKYYFFEYDTWANQEDLQRRSFLEQLIENLLENGILYGKTRIKTRGGEESKVTWNEKKSWLFAKKKESSSERYPLLTGGIVITGTTFILTPITTLIASILQSSPQWLRVVIALFPLIASLLYWGYKAYKNKKYRNIHFLRAIYENKIEKSCSYEVISEDEPTIIEFKSWIRDVSEFINGENCKKLVIVFDNMDRLPREKVRLLWSLIHTFFSETNYKNIWVIIPYDKKNLSCIFNNTSNTNETSQNKDTLTQHFIDKVFPVTFSVPKPVLTDYRAIFDIFYVDAFGDIGKENKEMINSLYRFFNPQANIRSIIIFINNLVSLYKTREQLKNDIGLVNMAIYLLKNFDIHKGDNEANNILSGDYLGDLTKNGIIYNDDNLKAEIAALTYGVNIETAQQIPLLEYIRGCVSKKEGYDINRHKNEKNFYMILKEVYDIEDIVKLPNMIDVLHNLELKDVKECNLDIISNIWEAIALKLLMLPLHEQILPDHYKILLNELK